MQITALLFRCEDVQLNGSVKELNKFHNYETEKITRKASDTAEYILSCLVLPPKIVMHDTVMLFSECPPIYASSCMTISGERTEQYVVIGFGQLAGVD